MNFAPIDHWICEEMESLNYSSIRGVDLLKGSLEDSVDVGRALVDRWETVEMPNVMMSLRYGMQESNSSRSVMKTPQQLAEKDGKIKKILETIPFVIPFPTRLDLFQQFIEQDKVLYDPNFRSRIPVL